MKSRLLVRYSLFGLAIFLVGSFLLNQNDNSTQTMTDASTPYLDQTLSIDERVADLLSRMTRAEKIGQMTLIEKNSLKAVGDISQYAIGALLSGSGSKPADNTATGWQDMVTAYQTKAAQSRLGIPLLYGSDAVHGHAHVSGMTVFPHMIGLGAAGDVELVRDIAAATAVDMRATGVNWNFAPNLDTPQDIRWGRVYETFSDDPVLVSKLGAAFVQGLQNPTDVGSDKPLQVLATPKHFLGLGGMRWNSSLNKNYRIDQGVTAADEGLLQTVYLPPFQAAVEAGALSIMVGLNTWGKDRTIRQPRLLTDILKGQLGFKGFVVSDWYGVHEGTSNTFFPTIRAINAGVDMVMLPFDYQGFARDMTWANRLGLISDARIDDAVSRILYAKFSLGLFDPSPTPTSDTTNSQHQALAREAVARSVVLLKNDEAILPIQSRGQTIHVAGSAADNVGRQLGAWSIEWQGIDGNELMNATSILAGIQAGSRNINNVIYSLDGNSTQRADIGIAVVGETPYAEGWGDNPAPTLNEADIETINNLRQRSDKVVVVLITGRPLIITNEIDNWDALVVAWLPGSEGAGVADVLFGVQPFTGTLPLPWLAAVTQVPIAPDGSTADTSPVLFPRYFGLQK